MCYFYRNQRQKYYGNIKTGLQPKNLISGDFNQGILTEGILTGGFRLGDFDWGMLIWGNLVEGISIYHRHQLC